MSPTVHTRYKWVDGQLAELTTVRFLDEQPADVPREEVVPPISEPEPVPQPVLPQPLEEAPPSDPDYTVTDRIGKGGVRGAWFIAFTATGEAASYALDNLAGLPIPQGTATVVGAALYGVKRAVWPDTSI